MQIELKGNIGDTFFMRNSAAPEGITSCTIRYVLINSYGIEYGYDAELPERQQGAATHITGDHFDNLLFASKEDAFQKGLDLDTLHEDRNYL